MVFVRHLPGMGQDSFDRQLQLLLSFCGLVDKIFLLCVCMIFSMLSVQLYPSFTVFLFRILWRGLLTGKFLSSMLRNSFPNLVTSEAHYGGVYQMMSRLRCFFFFCVSSVGGCAV